MSYPQRLQPPGSLNAHIYKKWIWWQGPWDAAWPCSAKEHHPPHHLPSNSTRSRNWWMDFLGLSWTFLVSISSRALLSFAQLCSSDSFWWQVNRKSKGTTDCIWKCCSKVRPGTTSKLFAESEGSGVSLGRVNLEDSARMLKGWLQNRKVIKDNKSIKNA